MKVESGDTGIAVVRATLNDGSALGDTYRLDGGDFFRACVNGVCRTMADNDSLDSPDYIARFDYQSSVDYVVSFNRQEAQNAPNSRATLPQAFTIVTPANHQQVTDGETVVVSWTPTGAPARASLSYTVNCTLLSGKCRYEWRARHRLERRWPRIRAHQSHRGRCPIGRNVVDHPLQHRRDRES